MRMWFGLEIDVVGLPPLSQEAKSHRVQQSDQIQESQGPAERPDSRVTESSRATRFKSHRVQQSDQIQESQGPAERPDSRGAKCKNLLNDSENIDAIL